MADGAKHGGDENKLKRGTNDTGEAVKQSGVRHQTNGGDVVIVPFLAECPRPL